jgi:hypothetical protein
MITLRNSTALHNFLMMSACMLLVLTGCGIYKFNDAVIPVDVKTIKINYIENKARYINPQASQKFFDKIQQKIIGGTKLSRTTDDAADYVINGTITTYDGTQTVGVSSQQASTNRLTVSLHIVWRDNKKQETTEFDVSRSFDYAASLSFQQAEAQLLDEVVRTLTDDIYNRMFSNW